MDQVKVLLVEDDAGHRMLLCDSLRGEPYTLLEADDGRQALAVIDQELPDLILLDVMLPVMDGMAVLAKLKEQDRTRHIPVIMVSGLGGDAHVSQCLDAGAVDYVVKSFSMQVVRARVRAALRNRYAAEAERLPRKRGKVIGLIGAKGGVGTTTVVVNTALALQTPDRSVAIVELRACMGTVAQQLGITSARNLQPLLELEERGAIHAQSVDKCLTRHATGLQLLLAPPTVDDQHEITSQQAEDILKCLAVLADYVLVDFPYLPSKATRAALRCCDFIALMISLDASCLASAQVLLAGLAAWGLGGNLLGSVLIAQHQLAQSPTTVHHARSQLNCRIVSVIPSASDLCWTALQTGQPLLLANPESTEARAFTELAARLATVDVPELTT